MCEGCWILILEWLYELCAYIMGLHYISCTLSLHYCHWIPHKTKGDYLVWFNYWQL